MKHSTKSGNGRIQKNSATRTNHRLAGRTPAYFPVVGVGASAGGLEAFTQLVQYLPPDMGMAFVLVQHLDPGHASSLTQILGRAASLPVLEATNDLRIQPNHIYVIPPNAYLTVARRKLKLHPRPGAGGVSHLIDSFLESLAEDQQECAIGVILSGAASDGTVGLAAVKAEGGITFAQDDSAKYDSMPRSAVAAGCVDFVLAPDQIARELHRISKHPLLARAARRSSRVTPAEEESPTGEPAVPAGGFEKILRLLHKHTGVDFSLYKSNTIQRRLNRRMILNKLETFDAYAHYLRQNEKELNALYADVLINVTDFFRNPESFDALKKIVFPKLIPDRSDETVRMWVIGCSTGQEAYSLAMAFAEFCDRLPRAPKLQIFATDLNEALLDKARAGLYPKGLMQGVSPERLRRFFVEQDGSYQVIKPLREAVVFARQNLLSDPPFSRIDLISCRNLLIYIESALQKRIVPTFHYALKRKGFLFLGASESVGPFASLFEPADRKQKIYSRKAGPSPAAQMRLYYRRSQGKAEIIPAKIEDGAVEAILPINAQREADRIARNRYAPPAVLLDDKLQILQFRGETGPYLRPAAGYASFDVLRMAREGLAAPLRAAISQAKKENKTVRVEKVRVNQNGQTRMVNLEVVPLRNLRENYFLISFEDIVRQPPAGSSVSSKKSPTPRGRRRILADAEALRQRVRELEDELNEARDHIQSTQEQTEAAQEELQASNEEITSANEELQSMNEELETSKEELESANEELTTVNEEMANRNLELNRLNSDLVNLQASTRLAILLLGRDLTIRRFTLQTEKQFNLLATDVGRPIGNIRHNLDVPDLEALIMEVIQTVREREQEVRDTQGRWYSLRIHPYFALDNKVDGAVVVLVDIDPIKRREQEIAAARDYAANIVETLHESLLVLDADLRVESANSSFYRCFHMTPASTEGKSIYDLGNGQWDVPELRQFLEELLPRHRTLENFEIERDFEQIGRRAILLNAHRINDPTWMTHRILLAIQDVTDQKRRVLEIEEARIAEAILATARDPLLILDDRLRVESANEAFYRTFKISAEEARQKSFLEVGNGQWNIPKLVSLLRDIIPRKSYFDNFEVNFQPAEGGPRRFLLNARMLKDQVDKIVLGIQDITDVVHFQTGPGQAD